MKIPNLSPRVLGSLGLSSAVLVLSAALSPSAHAFGGLWSSEAAKVKQSAEQIVFVDNPDATVTAIIQIRYEGPSQRFAWVIPIPGKPTVGFSSNTVFERLDAATAPQYWVEVAAEGICMPQDSASVAPDASAGTDSAPSALDPTAPVVVLEQGSAGPYDYVTITVDPNLNDPSQVATDWLTTNGYDLTSLDSTVLGPYLSDGLNLLAFKLQEGMDTGAIRPVILTYESKLPVIPIRPAAVAAQDDMGIQIWVIGPSQAVPENYKSLVINDALIDWLSGEKYVAGTLPAGGAGPARPPPRKPSNYDAVVTAAANEAGGRGFVTEFGGPANQYREMVWSTLDEQTIARVSSQSYADGIDAILAANSYYGGWDGWQDAVLGATTLPAGVTIEEFGSDPDRYRGAAEVDTAEFLQLLDEKVVKPVAETAALLYRAPYLTRLYSTMSSGEMAVDPVFNYNSDLAQVSNIHIAKRFITCNPALIQDDAPWRIELPQGGVIVGEGSETWPVAVGSMPANLKIVTLSTRGSGTVVEDNSKDIAIELWETAGMTGGSTAMLRPPQNGLMIGGTQTVTPRGQTGLAPGSASPPGSTRNSAKPSGSNGCNAVQAGTGSSKALALWLLLAAVIPALRRRRRHRP